MISRASDRGSNIGLREISEELMDRSLDSGVDVDEAQAEAQVTALVSALFLTNRGYTELAQEPGKDGKITLKPLWGDEETFSDLTNRLHPGDGPLGVVD